MSNYYNKFRPTKRHKTYAELKEIEESTEIKNTIPQKGKDITNQYCIEELNKHFSLIYFCMCKSLPAGNECNKNIQLLFSKRNDLSTNEILARLNELVELLNRPGYCSQKCGMIDRIKNAVHDIEINETYNTLRSDMEAIKKRLGIL